MRYIALFGALLIAVLAAALVRGAGPEKSQASSHREAPLISEDPTADNTDVYAFVSPDRPDTVTIIANYIPLEEPAGGPNFNQFGDDVLYELNVDNDGDAEEDVTYQFRFDDADSEPEHVPLQHRPDHVARPTPTGTSVRPTRSPGSRRTGKSHDARPRTCRPRRSTSAPARRRTTTRSVAAPRSRPRRRHQGLRRPARRPVLRRPRLGLRPGWAAAVQPGARRSRCGGDGVDTSRASTSHSIALQMPIRS